MMLVSVSMMLCPLACRPSRYFSWLTAIRMPVAVTKPETTGWLRKLARKPSRKMPMTTRIRPDRTARMIAAVRYSGVPCSATLPAATAVISDRIATGPTAIVRLVPKIA